MTLDMFRALQCSSSGGQIVYLQFLVLSLSLSCHTVHRFKEECSKRVEGHSVIHILLENKEIVH